MLWWMVDEFQLGKRRYCTGHIDVQGSSQYQRLALSLTYILQPHIGNHSVLRSVLATLLTPLNSPFKLSPGPFVLLNTTS